MTVPIGSSSIVLISLKVKPSTIARSCCVKSHGIAYRTFVVRQQQNPHESSLPSLVIHSRIYAGQFLSVMLFASQRLRKLTA